jgi:hypothetical protein
LDRGKDHDKAISAIDQCLQLMAGLLNGNVAFSEKARIDRAFKLI